MLSGFFFDNPHDALQLYAYSLNKLVDATSQRFSFNPRRWNGLADCDAPTIARIIQGDEIDLLIDLDGDYTPLCHHIMAHNPAPRQLALPDTNLGLNSTQIAADLTPQSFQLFVPDIPPPTADLSNHGNADKTADSPRLIFFTREDGIRASLAPLLDALHPHPIAVPAFLWGNATTRQRHGETLATTWPNPNHHRPPCQRTT